MSLEDLKNQPNNPHLIKKDRYEPGDIVKISDNVQFYDDGGAYSDEDPVYSAADYEWEITEIIEDSNGNAIGYDCVSDITIIEVYSYEIEGAIVKPTQEQSKEDILI